MNITIGKRRAIQNNWEQKPLRIFTGDPESNFAGKLIKKGKGVNSTSFCRFKGKAEIGTKSPERKRYGTNINRSSELAFSVQKHNEAIRLCKRNAIEKAKWIDK